MEWSNIGVDEGRQLRLGQGPDMRRDNVAILEQHQGWNAADPIFCGGGLILVDIELGHRDLSAVLAGNFLQDRGDHLAWPAPFRPVIDENGALGFQHIGIEGIIGNVDEVFAHGLSISLDGDMGAVILNV